MLISVQKILIEGGVLIDDALYIATRADDDMGVGDEGRYGWLAI